MSVRAGVVGAGAWGTTLANLLAESGVPVRMWAREAEVATSFRERGENALFLEGVALNRDRLSVTPSLERALDGADVVVWAVPVQHSAAVLERAAAHLRVDAVLVTASKGIEVGTLRTMDQILGGGLTDEQAHRLCVLSGPSFAREVAAGVPTAVAVASRDEDARLRMQSLFQTNRFRVYTNADVIGVELGGALKNVIGHGRQRQRLAHGHGPLQAALHAHGRRQIGPHLLVVVAEVADVELLQLRVGDVAGEQRAVGPVGLAVDRQRPDDLAVAEVGGHVDAEDEPVTARLEERRLPLVRPARLQVVVRADRHERLLVPVAVEVAEGQVERAVRALLPAVEGRRDVLAAAVDHLPAAVTGRARQQQGRRRRRDHRGGPRELAVRSHRCEPLRTVAAVSRCPASAAPAPAPGAAPALPRTAPR